MLSPEILVYGYGGHGRMIIEILQELGYSTIGIVDEKELNIQQPSLFYCGTYSRELYKSSLLILAIGDNQIRYQLSQTVEHTLFNLIHSSAIVAKSAVIGHGNVVLQQSVIQSNVHIGDNCIVNIGAKIDHDVIIGDSVHVAPQAYIGSGVKIGDRVLVGHGAIIMRNIVIPPDSIIPPGHIIQ
jgi:sugar O-acyltransferase (sialic acid O-acetyltransferase NeuD family)